MIAITVKWPVKPEFADGFPIVVGDFTQATRAEPGCLWFEWSRSLDDDLVYVLIEAFADDEAASAHVTSDHFRTAMATLGEYVTRRPQIISVTTDGDGWSELGELRFDGD